MTLFVTFPRILVIQRKIRASEAQTSSSGGCEIGAESKPRRGRLGREEGRGDTQLLPVTPAWDPLRGTPIGHTPGFVGARRARLGVNAPRLAPRHEHQYAVSLPLAGPRTDTQ